jgi:hypothetical protein
VSKLCQRCGGTLESGFTASEGFRTNAMDRRHIDPEKIFQTSFVIPGGTPTAANPVQAFKQGLEGNDGNRWYKVVGYRCSQCSALELYAENQIHSSP